MHRALLLLAFLPLPMAAQTALSILPEQCVWHSGDDPAWAAPDLEKSGGDENGWQPFQNWEPQFEHSRLWVRCHADLSQLRNDPHPAIQVTLYSAYQLYLDGVLIGAEGNLESGNSSVNAIRSYPAAIRSTGPGRPSLRCASTTA